MARKRKSKPTTKARSATQRLRDRYAHAREDAQLAGLIPTTPEEALTDERVDPASQGQQPLPGLVLTALRRGWEVPDEKKPRLVDELVQVIENAEAPHVAKVMAYNALTKADQMQYERDQPERAAKARGAVSVEVNNTVATLDLKELFRKADEQRKGALTGDRLTVDPVLIQTPSEEHADAGQTGRTESDEEPDAGGGQG